MPDPHIVIGLEEGLLDPTLVVLLHVAQGLKILHRHENVLAHPDLHGMTVLVGAGVVVGMHSVPPPMNHHGAQEGAEGVLALDRLQVEVPPDPVGDAVDDRTQFVDDVVFDFDLKQASEHGLQNFVGVGGHLATFCCESFLEMPGRNSKWPTVRYSISISGRSMQIAGLNRSWP